MFICLQYLTATNGISEPDAVSSLCLIMMFYIGLQGYSGVTNEGIMVLKLRDEGVVSDGMKQC